MENIKDQMIVWPTVTMDYVKFHHKNKFITIWTQEKIILEWDMLDLYNRILNDFSWTLERAIKYYSEIKDTL